MMLEFKTELLKHQLRPVEKFNRLKVGALYMPMGTGKTRTMLEIIKNKLDRGKFEKVIWLCPCSAKENINRDLKKHIKNGLDIFLIAGIESLSGSIRLNSFLLEYVKKYKCMLVVDESLKIKNIRAIRSTNIIRLGGYCEYKFILNGTPISRDEKDIFGQWYFLDWRILGYKSEHTFNRNHVLEVDGRNGKYFKMVNVDYITRKISPYTYQVKKEEAITLPNKIYKDVYFDLDVIHYEKYIEIAEYLISLMDNNEPNTVYRLFSHLLNVTSGYAYTIDDENNKTYKYSFYEKPMDNPRIICLLNQLDIIGENKKVIIFCEFISEIDSIVEVLTDKYGAGQVVRYDGTVSQKQRNINEELFKNKARFFIANKDCAGYSLNLQFCDTVIYYNNDWDQGTRSQSEDRVHRIGQTNEVQYINIIASDTIENKVIDCLKNKTDLVKWFRESIDKNKDKQYISSLVYSKSKKGKRGKDD